MRPAVQARVEGSSVPGMERAYTEPFTIGRGMQASLHVDSGRVSRLHAEVVYENGAWVLQDLGSTNGTYHEGQRVEQIRLGDQTAVRLGREGPFVYLSVIGNKVHASEARRSEPSAVSSSRQMRAEEDTQRQVEPYRPASSEEPTAWHEAPKERGPSETATRVGHDEERGAEPAYGKIAAVVLTVLLLIALFFLIL